jgi:predicted MFS family arabinose efflux permease
MVSAAFSLTALTYGLARFAYGLLLPSIRAELNLSATAAGWIGGIAFASYCLGVVLAFALVDRLGERRISMSAGLFAAGAMVTAAASSSGWHIGFAMAVGGLSTGLTSPPLASAVARTLQQTAQARANGIINAGTAVGIVISGAAAIAFAGNWRKLYVGFACLGLLITFWLWWAMPPQPQHKRRDAETFSWRDIRASGAISLTASAFLVGFASTAVWTFGANIMADQFGFSGHQIAIAWIVLGVVGIAGSITGLLSQRFGLGIVHRVSIGMMSLAILALAAAALHTSLAFIALALFGVAYIITTGTLLLWGIVIYSSRPATGLGVPFLVVAVGQTAGAPFFGMVWEVYGVVSALMIFAAIMASAASFTAINSHQ